MNISKSKSAELINSYASPADWLYSHNMLSVSNACTKILTFNNIGRSYMVNHFQVNNYETILPPPGIKPHTCVAVAYCCLCKSLWSTVLCVLYDQLALVKAVECRA